MSWKNDPAYPIPLPQAMEEWCTGTDDWFLKPWIPYGAVTLLVAPAKTGKTTWLMDLLAAQRHGVPFLGEIIPRVPVLYVTEQFPRVFKVQAIHAGILDAPGIFFTARYRLLGKSWADLCSILLELVQEHGILWVILDAWTGLAGFAAEGENDNAEARARLEQLGPICAEGAAVSIAAHQGHSDRSRTPISACRGASGLGDGVDQALWFQRVEGARKADPRRTLWAEGRYVEIPDHRVEIVRTATQISGQYVPPPFRGGLDAQTLPPWIWTYGSAVEERVEEPPAVPAPLVLVPPRTQTYTTEELATIWRCSRRTVLRRLEGVPHERVGAGTASRPFRYVLGEPSDAS